MLTESSMEGEKPVKLYPHICRRHLLLPLKNTTNTRNKSDQTDEQYTVAHSLFQTPVSIAFYISNFYAKCVGTKYVM